MFGLSCLDYPSYRLVLFTGRHRLLMLYFRISAIDKSLINLIIKVNKFINFGMIEYFLF